MIYFMRGTSCSGKDSVIRTAIDQGLFGRTDVLSSDDMRGFISGDRSNQEVSGEAFSMMRHLLERRLNFGAKTTVINATNLRYANVDPFIGMARLYSEPYRIIEIESPSFAELCRRNLKRYGEEGMLIPEHVFEKHLAQYKTKAQFRDLQDFDNLCDGYCEDLPINWAIKAFHGT